MGPAVACPAGVVANIFARYLKSLCVDASFAWGGGVMAGQSRGGCGGGAPKGGGTSSKSGGAAQVHVRTYDRGTGDVKAYTRGGPGSGSSSPAAVGGHAGNPVHDGHRTPDQHQASARLHAARAGGSFDAERDAAKAMSAANRLAGQRHVVLFAVVPWRAWGVRLLFLASTLLRCCAGACA